MALEVVATCKLRIAGLDKPMSSRFTEKDRKQGGGVTEEDISAFHSGPPLLHTCVHTCIYYYTHTDMCAHTSPDIASLRTTDGKQVNQEGGTIWEKLPFPKSKLKLYNEFTSNSHCAQVYII